MTKKTPQEKKRLSYAKDRRHYYGESPHGAHTSIRLRKALRNRANRQFRGRAGRGAIRRGAVTMLDRAPKQWDKWPDAPLLRVVRGKLEDRARMEAGGGRRARLKKASGSA